MVTTETWDEEVGPCPCGTGKVVIHVVSPDHPWGGGSRAYWLQCRSCSQEWEIQEKSLVKRSTRAEWEEAQEHLRPIRAEIRRIVCETVDANTGTFSNKKKCWEWMKNLRITRGNLQDFYKHLKSGKTAGQFASVRDDSEHDLLCNQAERIGKKARLTELFAQEKAVAEASGDAAKKIERRPIEKA